MTVNRLGRQIRAVRRSHQLTQSELAALSGVGNRFVSDLENGKPGIELGRCLQVAEALGLRLSLEPRNWLTLGDRDDD